MLEENLVKKTLTLTVLMILLVFVILAFAAFNTNIAKATDANGNYSIEYAEHTIQLLHNGYILVNDTIKINVTGQAPSYFLIGFPYKFGEYVLQCVAFNETNKFQVTLNTPLGDRAGFYGANITFPDITPQVFTVMFVLSNELIALGEDGGYYVSFPGLPSLTKPVAKCNVSINIPDTSTQSYSIENLPEFTYNVSTSKVGILMTQGSIILVDFEELKRVITINEIGEMEGADTYRIWNKSPIEVYEIKVTLPLNSSNPTVYDLFGRKIADESEGLEPITEKPGQYKITKLEVRAGESTWFTVRYKLPKEFIIHQDGNRFKLNINLFEYLDVYIKQASATLVLPEGARITSLDTIEERTDRGYSVTRNVFQETFTIEKSGLTYLEAYDFAVVLTYEYNPLWLSFRPTLWIWTLVVVGCAVVFVWKRPKSPKPVKVPSIVVKLRPEHIKAFVEAYEEKRKIISELESLESRVRKGKIPRRRYKVQKKILETRLTALSKSLAEGRERLQSAGGKYADLMRQLEVAETEIGEVESNIRSIEARHARGDLSLEAYRNLLAGYNERKEKAETAITGIMLRLREEMC
jgi:hypothetical protein